MKTILILALFAILFSSCSDTKTYIEPFRVEGISSNGMYNKKYKVDLADNAGTPTGGGTAPSRFSIYTDSISFVVGDIIYLKKFY